MKGLKDVSNSAVVEFGCISFRILWVSFRSIRVNLSSWSEFGMDMATIYNGYELCVMRGLNGEVGDGACEDITDEFEVPGVIENGKSEGFCEGKLYTQVH